MNDRTFLAVCREFGEYEIARLFLEERDELARRREEGRTAVWGPIPSAEELDRIVKEVDRRMASEDADQAKPEEE